MADRLLSVDSVTKLPPAAVQAAWDTASTRVAKGSLRINVADYASAAAGVAAAPAGSTVFFPPGIYVNPTGLGNGITVLADNVTIEMAAGAEIQCNTWGQPGIDCVGRSGITIIGGVVRYTGTRGDHLGNSGRASALYGNGCGAFFNKDRNTIHGLRTIDMPVGVFFSSWATSTATDYRGTGNRVYGMEVEGADWGILWTAQDDFIVDGLYFHDDIDDSSGANPTHALYCSSTDTFRSHGVAVSNLITSSCLFGQPYQVKYADNIQMTNLVARNSRGLLNVIGCVDLSVTDATATGCLVNPTAPAGAITVQGLGASRHRYRNITIEADQTTGYNERLFIMDAADSVIDGLTVISKRTADSSNPVAQVRGLRNTVRNVDIRDTSGVNPPALFIGGSSVDSSDTHVDGIRMSGCKRVVDLYAPATGTIRYQRPMVAPTTGVYVFTASGTPDYSVYEDGLFSVNSEARSGATSLTAASLGRMQVCTVSSAFTLTLPTPVGYAGRQIGVRVARSSTQLLTLATAAGNIDGSSTRIMWAGESAVLESDGTNWLKIAGRAIPMSASMGMAATQSISSGTITSANLDVSRSNPTGLMVNTGSNRIDILRPAAYAIVPHAALSQPATTMTRFICLLQKNGATTAIQQEQSGCTSGGFPSFAAVDEVALVAGDYVKLQAYQLCTTPASMSYLFGTGVDKTSLAVREIVDW